MPYSAPPTITPAAVISSPAAHQERSATVPVVIMNGIRDDRPDAGRDPAAVAACTGSPPSAEVIPNSSAPSADSIASGLRASCSASWPEDRSSTPLSCA